ncbi:MAG: dihydroneopterin aldolase [Verrucomicrobiales bacterium]|nr:dihydroneopterin aldolase [Verrucomicrobiales bacterium]
MDTIIISDLEVHYHIGVPDEERAKPQRLLISLELDHDFSRAAAADDLTHTLNYDAICQRLKNFGDGRSWKLIETLAVHIAEAIRLEFKPARIRVIIKKFIIPGTQFVAVRIERGPLRPPETARERVMRQIGGVPGGMR